MLIEGLGVRPQVRSHIVCTHVVVWSLNDFYGCSLSTSVSSFSEIFYSKGTPLPFDLL